MWHPFYGMILPLAGIAFSIFVVVKVVDYLKLKATISGDGTQEPGAQLEDLQVRLTEIERRLTDVQDVMIALSEKFDRWEREKAVS